MSGTTITLVPYDRRWPEVFCALADRIRAVLGAAVIAVHHAGSTSVPGLSAKPIIDIVLAVADSTDEGAYVPALTTAGFVFCLREPDWFEHRLMTAVEPAANVHVFSAGCPEIDRMLMFRDWLRANDDDRLLYERTKQDLAGRRWASTQAYADAKSEVVSAIIDRAVAARAG
jgi:GrpB-like predicted nucleotidyltransferase (UPF0157 family)